MKLNKLLIYIWLLVLISLHVNAKSMHEIEIEYINFNNITLNNLFGFLGKEYAINFSIEPEFRQNRVSIHLQNSNLQTLLDVVTLENGLAYKVSENVVYIAPIKQSLSKKFRSGDFNREKVVLDYASLKDALQFLQDMFPAQVVLRSTTINKPYSNLFDATPDLEIPKGLEEQTDAFAFPEITDKDAASLRRYGSNGVEIDRNVPTETLHVIPFYNTNTIYLLSTSKGLLEEARLVLKEIDQPLKQVLIQGQIMEFTIGDGFNSIFDFAMRSSKLIDSSENPSSVLGLGNIQYSFLDSQLVANIDIAKREGRASFVSSPLLLTMNRTSSTLDLTEDVSLVTGVKEGSTSTNEGTSVVIPPTPIYTTRKIGTQLTITPYINSKEEILLKIDIQISAISGNTQTILVPTATGATQEYQVDGVSTSNIETVLSAANQQSIIFGGIVRKTLSKEEKRTPILGDIPLLGIPFRNIQDSSEKKELIIILTPMIVDLKNPENRQVLHRIRENASLANKQEKVFNETYIEGEKETLLDNFREKKIADKFDKEEPVVDEIVLPLGLSPEQSEEEYIIQRYLKE
jgi:type II secretory pathway component GspD/PulD (secretin)